VIREVNERPVGDVQNLCSNGPQLGSQSHASGGQR
jgi:hypothetical protein